jgi:hypothetical protein
VWKSRPARSADSAYPAATAEPQQAPEEGALVHHGSSYPATAWDQNPYNDPRSLRGRALWDQAEWQVPYPVAEISANQHIDDGDYFQGAPESITRWTPWGHQGVTPLENGAPNQPSGHRLLGNANFFASDPSRGPGSPSSGCYMSTDWTHMVLAQPGTVMIGHQTFWGPYQPKPSVDFYPSTVYQPFPSFGSMSKKVP